MQYHIRFIRWTTPVLEVVLAKILSLSQTLRLKLYAAFHIEFECWKHVPTISERKPTFPCRLSIPYQKVSILKGLYFPTERRKCLACLWWTSVVKCSSDDFGSFPSSFNISIIPWVFASIKSICNAEKARCYLWNTWNIKTNCERKYTRLIVIINWFLSSNLTYAILVINISHSFNTQSFFVI